MEMRFPGGLEVDADYKGFLIRTDQPVEAGGGGTAPHETVQPVSA